MATLKTNTLTGTSTAGSIAVTGEGNSTTTNLQQGLCKGWVQFDGTASGAAERDSFNLSGMTDHGTGDYTSTLTNALANNDYSVHISGSAADFIQQSVTTSASRVEAYNTAATIIDTSIISVSVHGDLA